jgi:aminopeptidase N
MKARLLAFLRILKRLLSVVAVVLVLLMLGVSVGAYLAVTGKSLPTLRFVTAKVGQLIAGQRTEHLRLDVHVSPANARLTGTATLTVRSLQEGRRRFYFLLNDGLRVTAAHVSRGGTPPQPAAAYQLWLLTIVDLDTPLAQDATADFTFDYDGTPAAGLLSSGSSLLNPQQILLPVDAFWYPTDVQGFFSADVTLTLPNTLTVVHNGLDATSAQRGTDQQVRWQSTRPVAGMALVAGPYTLTSETIDGITYRLYLAENVKLNAHRVLTFMANTNRFFTDRFGTAGFPSLTAFVSRDLRRAFNDGSGLMGLSIRYFRAGDYGFATLAHEIAHDWWGDTVAERWLTPGTGGEWIVEGLAECSSLLATEAAYGADALTRRLAGEFFDPARQTALTDMSVLDNALAEATARDTIYRKGAYVAMMLRHKLGDEAYFRGLQQFVERFRYQQVTDHDLQQVLQDVSQEKLDGFFADWVRSARLADLALDTAGQTELTVKNLGNATSVGDLDLWTFKKGSGEPLRGTVHIGDHVPLSADIDAVVLDPLLTWADVQRENNRYPRRTDPVYVAASPHGEFAVTNGEVFPWVGTTVSNWRDGKPQHHWELKRGMTDPPVWFPDGQRLVIGSGEDASGLPDIVTLAPDGSQHTIGHGTSPMPGADGAIYAARQERIVRWTLDGAESTVAQRRGESLEMPLPSPDGGTIVYSAARGNRVELRIADSRGGNDRGLLAWDRDRMLYRWAPDGSRVYSIVGGDWDWQIWEIPLAPEGVRVLVHEAAAIGDLAVSPDGKQLAFTAAPELAYPTNRRQLYVMDLADRAVHPIDVPGADLSQVVWLSADQLVVVATALVPDQPWTPLASRALKRVRVSDGSVEDMTP